MMTRLFIVLYQNKPLGMVRLDVGKMSQDETTKRAVVLAVSRFGALQNLQVYCIN